MTKYPIIHTMPQLSEEWFAIRAGKMTGSHAQEIGNNGKGLETYIWNLLSEKYSSAGNTESYMNDDMKRGIELEAQAKGLYAMETGADIQEVGFIEVSEYFGISPDALIGNAGLLEVKAHNDKKHFMLMINGEDEIESKYIWQMNAQMLATGRNYCIYLSYNPNFKKSHVSFEIKADKEMQDKIKKGLEAGKKLIKEIEKKYQQIIS